GWLVLIILTYLAIEGLTFVGIIDPFYEITVVNIFINIILAVGLNLIVGFSGQLSLGHAGFMAIGANMTGIVLNIMPNQTGFSIRFISYCWFFLTGIFWLFMFYSKWSLYHMNTFKLYAKSNRFYY